MRTCKHAPRMDCNLYVATTSFQLYRQKKVGYPAGRQRETEKQTETETETEGL